jgi:hypothetical protein
MATATSTKTPRAIASALRKAAENLVAEADAIDGRKTKGVLLDWGDNDPTFYLVCTDLDLSDPETLAGYMDSLYIVSGYRSAKVFDLEARDGFR